MNSAIAKKLKEPEIKKFITDEIGKESTRRLICGVRDDAYIMIRGPYGPTESS